MKTRSSELLTAALSAAMAWSVLAPCAWAAPPSAADKAEAQRLYVEGKALRDRGKTEEAIAALRRSHELAPTPVTRLELARVLVSASHLVEAHTLLASIPAMPVSKTETAKSADARKEAEALATSVLATIPRVTIRVTSSDEGAVVTLDDAALDDARLGTEQQIDPGTHVAVLRAGDRRTERTFTLSASEQRTIELALEPAAPVVAPPLPPPPAPRPTETRPVQRAPAPPPDEGGSPAVPIAFTIAGIGLATGAVTGVIAIVQADELKDACVGGKCSGPQLDLLSTHQAVTTTSTVAFALGGAAAAVGVVLVLVDGGDDDEPRPTTALRVSGTGLAIEGTWQ